MKKLALGLVAGAVAAVVALPAMAETNVSLGYARASQSVDPYGDATVGLVSGTFGWKAANHLGVEAEGSFGVSDDTILGVKVKVDHELALYGTGTLSLSPSFDVMGRVGYGTTSSTAKFGSTSASDDAQSWNFGVAATAWVSGNNGVRFDYTRYAGTDDGGDAYAWRIAYTHKF